MKKNFIALILIVALAATAAAGIAVTYKEIDAGGTRFAVISDIHILSESYFTSSDAFSSYASEDKLIHLSEAILKTVVDGLIADKSIKSVLVPGDLTENGDIISHRAAADILQRLKRAGKQVFVINGNHDSVKNPAQQGIKADAALFREIYGDFGYNRAVEKDSRSLSYAADIDSNYRIIAIDNDNYLSSDLGGYKEEIDAELIAWAEAQVKKCIEDGKTPIAMAHKPLADHIPSLLTKLMGMNDSADSFKGLASALADNGCHYIFTGHMHGQDIAEHVSPDGGKLLDIETSSLLFPPYAYRKVHFTPKSMTITSFSVDSLNKEYVPLFADTDSRLVSEDFGTYCAAHYKRAMESKVLGLIGADTLQSLFKLPADNPLTVKLAGLIRDALMMPLYGEDSLDEIVTSYGGAPLPRTAHEKLTDIAAFIVRSINSGDENLHKGLAEMKILKETVKAVFYLLEQNKLEFEEDFPGISDINIDLERLFQKGELEVVDSGVVGFLLAQLDLPSALRNLNFSNLKALSLFAGAYFNEMYRGLGDKVKVCIGEKHLDIDTFIDEAIYGVLLADVLKDPPPADNDVKINRKELQTRITDTQ